MNTLEYLLEKYPDKPWHWGAWGLSMNPSITPEFIEKHLDKPWNWLYYGLSSNASITGEFIEKHLDKWYWGSNGLSRNTFAVCDERKRKQRISERTALLSCKLDLPEDLMRHITSTYI